ncbi:amidohydrolase family protein [Streptomyces sp. NPDC014734]|uniref:amidohydrolase family protein n=1 Tax=Streptomyces sp. NPDC014734 TaxID=3364886 RepID=UPI0036FC4E10
MSVIDCHAHLWNPGEGFGWIRPGAEHHRTFSVPDLEESGAGCEVTGTVLVEASRGDRGETSALRGLRLLRPDLVAGYVGNLHVHGEDGAHRFRALLDAWGDTRPNGMRVGGRTWADTPEKARGLVPVLAETGVVLELNLADAALRTAAEVASRHPALTVVVDHLGNPPNLRTEPTQWYRDVEHAAALPNVVVKISGLLTQQHGVPGAGIARLVRHVADAFGPARCLVGSDWPICLPRGSRAASLAAARSGIAHLSDGERQEVLHGTPARVYGLRG